MEYTHLLLRYGELFLKGKNRHFFEQRLVENIKKLTGIKQVHSLRGRLVVDYFSDHHLLKNVFGLVSYSPALKVEKDMEEIKKVALSLLEGKQGSFKVETKRSDKQFPLISPEINSILGAFIEQNTVLQFNLKEKEQVLNLEINQNGAYLFFESRSCFGGLPTGVEGEVFLLLENQASLLAGILFMKRGCSIIPVSYSKFNLSLLQKFNPQKLELKIIANLNELKADFPIIAGQNFEEYKKIEVENLIFRPLISFSEQEIKEKTKQFS